MRIDFESYHDPKNQNRIMRHPKIPTPNNCDLPQVHVVFMWVVPVNDLPRKYTGMATASH